MKNRKLAHDYWNIVKRAAAVLCVVSLLGLTAGCGSTGASGAKVGEAQNTGAAGPGRELSAEGTSGTETGGNGGAAAAAAAEGAVSIEIPENPHHREDGGVSIDVFAMDTYMTLLAYGDRAEEAVLAAAEEIHSLDDRLSTGNPESEISRINAAGAGSASEVVLYLVEQSRMLYDETGGLFDIAIYPVMKLWGFPTQDFRVPEKTEIEAALKLADASAISIETEPSATDKQAPAAEAAATGEEAAGTAATEEQAAASAGTGEPAAAAAEEQAAASAGTVKPAAAVKEEPAAAEPEESPAETYPVLRFGLPGMEIDLGGIAKGYTGNRVMEIFKEHGISHGLISLGGNVQALGSKEDGSAWRVAIQNPESGQGYLGILDIKDKAVITSGGYERYFEQDGVRYHHIIDPRTGYPADSGLLSATIVSEDGTLADGLSTSLFIMGKEEAEKYWRVHPDRFDYILEDADGTLYVTEGAADLLTTDAKTVIIRR